MTKKIFELIILVCFLLPTYAQAETAAELMGLGMPAALASALAHDSIDDDMLPESTGTYDLGSTSKVWLEGHINTLYSDYLDIGATTTTAALTVEGEATVAGGNVIISNPNGGVRMTAASGQHGLVTTGSVPIVYYVNNALRWTMEADGDFIQDATNGQNMAFNRAGTGIYFQAAEGIMHFPDGTDLPDTPSDTGSIYYDTNDGQCDDANDAGGTALCWWNGSGWIQLGGS